MNEDEILNHPAVVRVKNFLSSHGMGGQVLVLRESARTAAEAAAALGIEVGQVASSIVFQMPNGDPLLVITSGRHRVDTEVVARNLGVERLLRADADFVRSVSGFAIGGVAPVAWVAETKGAVAPIGHLNPIHTFIDTALAEYPEIWAAAGHPHAVFPTTYQELQEITGATAIEVATD